MRSPPVGTNDPFRVGRHARPRQPWHPGAGEPLQAPHERDERPCPPLHGQEQDGPVDGDRIEPRPESSWPERIVVGIDTSVESLAALQCALALAVRAGSTLVAVHASGTEESRWDTQDIDRLVRRACTREGCADVLIGRSIVEAGPPAEALIRAAERVGGELLVIGRRGLGAAASSLGSTSEAVLDVAGIPVLIVPSRCSTDTVAAGPADRSAATPSVPSSDVAE